MQEVFNSEIGLSFTNQLFKLVPVSLRTTIKVQFADKYRETATIFTTLITEVLALLK